MKKYITLFTTIVSIALLVACEKSVPEKTGFDIDFPVPSKSITKVALSEQEEQYVRAGSFFSLQLLNKAYSNSNIVISPLSVQFSLGMALNGARGNTAEEIVKTLGYGEEGPAALTAFHNSLIKQIPSVGNGVTVKMADAVLADTEDNVNPSFQRKIESSYYAPVVFMPFTEDSGVLSLANEWIYRNTEGLFNNVFDRPPAKQSVLLVNALYFKGKWAGNDGSPMFSSGKVIKDGKFRINGVKETRVDYLYNFNTLKYAETDKTKVLSLPYGDGKFSMQILLPVVEGEDSVREVLSWLQDEDAYARLTGSLASQYVYVQIPKFEIESSSEMKDILMTMGISDAFGNSADFGDMVNTEKKTFSISSINNKAKIKVTEWGTEAASVTSTKFQDSAVDSGVEPSYKTFIANHPFVFVITENTSGAILFEGVFQGL